MFPLAKRTGYAGSGTDVVPTYGPQDAQAGAQDPTDVLSALLAGQYQPTPDFTDGTARNNALAEALGRKYGVDSSAPQVDLESLDKFVRGADVQQKLGETMPIAQMQAQTQAAAEAAREKSALDVENLRGQFGLQQEGLRGQNALDVEAAKNADKNAPPGPGVPGAPLKLGQQERGIVEMAGSVTKLGKPILQELENKYPGIDQDPTKYGSWSDMLTSKLGKGWYSLGGMPDNDPIIQKSEAIKIWAARALMMGRVNKQIYDDILAHLPSGGYSPGANYDRMKRLLTDILPAQVSGVEMAHPELQPGTLQGYINSATQPTPQP